MLIEITVYVRYVNVVTWLLCVEFTCIYGLSYCALCLFYFAYSDWSVIFMDNLIGQIFVFNHWFVLVSLVPLYKLLSLRQLSKTYYLNLSISNLHEGQLSGVTLRYIYHYFQT